jgi:signal transduction histidine kinase
MYNDISSLLSSSPGSLAYHLLLSFSLLSALIPAINQLVHSNEPKSYRRVIGIGLLLLLRLGVFLLAALVNFGAVWLYNSLPVVNRLVDTLTIILLIWLWATPKPIRWSDLIFGLAGAVILAGGFIATIIWIRNGLPNTFNESGLSFVWGLLNTTLLVAGVLLMILLQPGQWTMGVVMISTLFVGELVHLIFPNPNSDYPFMVRLVNMAAFPLLLGLPGLSELFSRVKTEQAPAPVPVIQVARKIPADSIGNTGVEKSVFKNILGMFDARNKTDICHSLSKFIAQALVADLCVFFSPPDDKGIMEIHCGYDLVMQEYLKTTAFNQSIIPGIELLLNKKLLNVPQDNPDLVPLAHRLHLSETGNFLAIPILDDHNDLICILGVLSPYTKYKWSHKDQEYLNNASDEIAAIFQKSRFTGPSEEIDKGSNIFSAQANLAKLSKQNENLRKELATLKALNLSYEEQAGQLGAREKEIETASNQIEAINRQLNEANQKIAELESRTVAHKEAAGKDPEVLASMIQELRQPLSAISGYTDLLLSESVGELSPEQRQYIDRMKASSDRMGNLISDMVRMTILEYGVIKLVPRQIELNELIDEIIDLTSAQFRQRNIVLRVDLPQVLPAIETDKDAALQILLNLVQNASLATPPESEIKLQAKVLPNTGLGEQIQVAISDSGEGIPEGDLAHVFTLLQRADKPLIPGIGDAGVGLVIAKTLAEKLGGEISVESTLGRGSTFLVKLPLKLPPAPEQGKKSS